MDAPVIVWFRRDLRLADNPALSAAFETGRPIVPLYVLEDTPDLPPPGAAGSWWLHHSLRALGESLAGAGLRLILRRGDPEEVLSAVVARSGAGAVYWNRRYVAAAATLDTRIKAKLRQGGIAVETFDGALLFEPRTIRTGAGAPYKVFTPFWKACRAAPAPRDPLPAPPSTQSTGHAAPDDAWKLASDDPDDRRLAPRNPDWASGFGECWQPGEAGAAARLSNFLRSDLERYAVDRDRPDRAATSRLSPHLHFGEISPHMVWHQTRMRMADGAGTLATSGEKFLAELGWREFSHHLLFHFPAMESGNFRPEFDNFPWIDNPDALRAWQRGQTGYPLVDAGMRELWRTGWMHNRLRMVVASFLTKNLRIHWREGAAWFQDALVDADRANNIAGWQWVAGSGADAAPYFRIFNPVSQGEKFDPSGAYVRQWVPELAALPDAVIHKPWTASRALLAEAGIVPGQTYPCPLVDHKIARRDALAAYDTIRGRK